MDLHSASNGATAPLSGIANEALRKRHAWILDGWDDDPPLIKESYLHDFWTWCQEEFSNGADAKITETLCPGSSIVILADTFQRVSAPFIADLAATPLAKLSSETSTQLTRVIEAIETSQPTTIWHANKLVDLWICSLLRNDKSAMPKVVFFDRLALPEASDVVDSLRSFILKFDPGESDSASAALMIHEFVDEIAVSLRIHPAWRSVTPEDWHYVVDGVEKFLICKLYKKLFVASESMDAAFEDKCRQLTHMRLEHLELPQTPHFLEPGWALTRACLMSMDQFRCPKDKLRCMLNACSVASSLLSFASKSVLYLDGVVGADQLVPALIYAVAHTKAGRLISNTEFVEKVTQDAIMASELGYMFTNIVSAISYVQSLNAAEFQTPEATEAVQSSPHTIRRTYAPTTVTAALSDRGALEAVKPPSISAFWKAVSECDALASTPLPELSPNTNYRHTYAQFEDVTAAILDESKLAESLLLYKVAATQMAAIMAEIRR